MTHGAFSCARAADHDSQSHSRHNPSADRGVLFVTSRIANISFEKMSRAILPWLIPLLIVLLMNTIWPPLTLWLPGLLTGR